MKQGYSISRAGNDAVVPPEATDVFGSAWGTTGPDIRRNIQGRLLRKNRRNEDVYEKGQKGRGHEVGVQISIIDK